MKFKNPFCECGNYVEGTTDHCGSCNRALRKELENIQKETAKNKKLLTTKKKQRSTKRAQQEGEYARTRGPFLEEHPFCQVRKCSKVSNQVHHKAGRIGYLLLHVPYWLAVCETCHEKIENNPDWAKAEGYSISRLENKLEINS